MNGHPLILFVFRINNDAGQKKCEVCPNLSVHKDMERKHPLLVRALSEEDSGISTFSTNSEYVKVKVIPQPLNLTRLEVEVNENGLNTTSKNVSLFYIAVSISLC